MHEFDDDFDLLLPDDEENMNLVDLGDEKYEDEELED